MIARKLISVDESDKRNLLEHVCRFAKQKEKRKNKTKICV